MKIVTKIIGAFIMSCSLLAIAGVVSASPADTLQPASTITYSEPVVVNSTLTVSNPGYFAQGVHIGSTEAGVGGVTYFNGTIRNIAVDSDGADTIPVTFGDDVRIDGEIYRSEVGGNDPLKLSDTLMPAVNNTYDIGISSRQWKDGYFAGTLTVGSLSTAAGGANLPLAYGFCDLDGTLRSGTSNVACEWDATNSRYEITITDETYYYLDYVTSVTPSVNAYTPVVGSIDGKLTVYFTDSDGTAGQQTHFQFVTYKPSTE
ncbi:MAG: hypothetical protein HQ530_00255 [Parcubacteria group bacterium]|nr:hypothetical protein [Parcubacteria group bacterium]